VIEPIGHCTSTDRCRLPCLAQSDRRRFGLDRSEVRRDDQFYFNLKAANGKVILTSEMYTSRWGRDNGIRSVAADAPDAHVDDFIGCGRADAGRRPPGKPAFEPDPRLDPNAMQGAQLDAGLLASVLAVGRSVENADAERTADHGRVRSGLTIDAAPVAHSTLTLTGGAGFGNFCDERTADALTRRAVEVCVGGSCEPLACHRPGHNGQPSHPHVIIDGVTDATPEELEQLARSVAMSGVLGDRDRLDVVIALRRLAEIDKAKRRHPSGGRVGHTEDTSAWE
jgi:uncharacterized protein YegP (UPF0339 family)